MYEHRKLPLLSRVEFAKRMALHGGVALLAVALALFAGIVGYHVIAGFSWIDAILDASMILGGMGPVHPLDSDAGKLFASAYALFSGVVFLAVFGLLFAPLLHRLIHKFHLDGE